MKNLFYVFILLFNFSLATKAAVTEGTVTIGFEDAISGLTQANKSGSGSDKDFNEMVVEVQVTVAYTANTGIVNGDAYFLLNPLVNGAEHDLQLVVSKFVSDNISGSCSLIEGDTSTSICGNGKNRVVYSNNTDLFEAGAPVRYANSTSHTFGPNSKVLKISGFGATGLNVNDGLAEIVQKTFSLKNLTLSTEIDSDTTVDGAHASIVMASGFGVAKEKSNFFDAFIGSENTASVDGVPIKLCQLGSADFATNNCANKIAKFLRTSDDAYFSGRNDLNRPDISGNKKFEVARVNSIDGGGNFGFNSANRFNLSGGDLTSFWTESFIDSGNTTHLAMAKLEVNETNCVTSLISHAVEVAAEELVLLKRAQIPVVNLMPTAQIQMKYVWSTRMMLMEAELLHKLVNVYPKVMQTTTVMFVQTKPARIREIHALAF